MNIFRKTTNFDFMGKRGIFFSLSLIAVVASLLFAFWRGADLLSFDFTGGYLAQLEFNRPVETGLIRQKLTAAGYQDILIQKVGEEGRRLVLKTKKGGSRPVIQLLQKSFPEMGITVLGEEEVSPLMGKTIRRQTAIAFILAMVGILAYIALRFEFRFAVGAIVALIHDLLVVLGFLAVTGKDIDSIIIAAFLTLAGYSVNDTVVIFDRIRERMRRARRLENPEAFFNAAINETLPRTLITVFSTIIAALCLFFFGGPVLHNFAFVLLIGFIVGTYSSIFIASALVVAWEKRQPHHFKI